MAIGTGAAILGGSLISGALGSSGAKSAASAQERAAAEANATQRYIYDQTRQDNRISRQAGDAATNKLATLLGLSTGGNYNGQQLLMSNAQGAPTYNPSLYASNPAYKKAYDDYLSSHNVTYGSGYTPTSDFGQIEDYIRSVLPAEEPNYSNSEYGSLLRKFGQSDLDNDVVYQSGLQFGLDQGNQGINRMAAAGGGLLSGATLKALTRFGNDYGSTKANEAYNRYNTTNDSIYNKLAGISGAGQQATNQVSSAGQNYGNQVGNTQQALGNARGASAIAQGNAWGNALAGGINAYQQQNYINSLNNNGYGGYNEEMNRLMGQG